MVIPTRYSTSLTQKMHIQYILYWDLHEKNALSLYNNYLFPGTKYVPQNHQPMAKNHVFAFLVSTYWYKIAFFAWHDFEFLWKSLDFKFLCQFLTYKIIRNTFGKNTFSNMHCIYCGQFLSIIISIRSYAEWICWRSHTSFWNRVANDQP